MSLLDKLRLLSDFSPLFIHVQAFTSATGEYGKGLAVIDAVNFLCGKTASVDDDKLARDVEAVLKSAEGKKLFDDVVEILRREGK
jgi:hypothetical protein